MRHCDESRSRKGLNPHHLDANLLSAQICQPSDHVLEGESGGEHGGESFDASEFGTDEDAAVGVGGDVALVEDDF